MIRYLRLYANFLRFSFSKALEFRLDFFFRVVMDLVFYALHLTFYAVIYQHTAVLGGWNLDQALVFVATFLVVDALHMTFFANNLWWLPLLINKGDLDYYLVRPVAPLFFLSLREFAANSFLNLFLAAGILGWAVMRLPGEILLADYAMYTMLLLSGAFLYYLMNMVFIIPVFWTHSGRGFGDLYFKMQALMEKPDRIFSGWVRKMMVSVLPFALIASYPSRALLENWDWRLPVHVMGATALVWFVVVGFWRLGLKSYSSASS